MHYKQPGPQEIGHRLRVWRARFGFNQKDVADRVAATQPTISRVERGIKPGVSLAKKLEGLMAQEDEEINDIDAETIQTIARSSEFRALLKRIAETLAE